MRKWCFLDLVTDHATGKLRESSVWSNVAKLSMTWAFIWTVLNDKQTEWLWAAYGGLVMLHEGASRFLNMKASNANEPKGD